MNKNIDLTKILKDLEGLELYSTIFGPVILTEVSSLNSEFPIKFEGKNYAAKGSVTKYGKHFMNLGDCTLFPSKYQRNWNKFKRPLPSQIPVMCNDDYSCKNWVLEYYKGVHKNYHVVYDIKNKYAGRYYKYIIPFNKFNPNNIEESLKHNIQK